MLLKRSITHFKIILEAYFLAIFYYRTQKTSEKHTLNRDDLFNTKYGMEIFLLGKRVLVILIIRNL